VSRIGFGCAPIGGYDYGPVDDATSRAAIHAALEHGITFFDTADVYGLGRSERVLGEALRGRRHEAVIATKGGVAFDADGRTRRTLDPRHLAQAIDDSLRRLGTDHVDLYQLHWPDGVTPVTEAVGAVVRMVEAGKVRHVGLCNFPLEAVRAAQAVAPIVSLQVPRSLLEPEWAPAITGAWRACGTGTIAYNALAQGLFTGKYDAQSRFAGTDLRARSALFTEQRLAGGLGILARLREVGAAHGTGPAAVALAWLLEQEGVQVALCGIKTPDQARLNADAGRLALDAAELARLAEVAWTN
jgi:aryl-alcohol dehydrogenase-like predicted oxidoreductase